MKFKHIAPHLRYKLPARLSKQGIFNLDSEYPNENAHKIGYIESFNCDEKGNISWGILRINDKYSFDFEEGDIDILLRPLSDLTKPITVNGYNKGLEFIAAAKMITHGFHNTFWYDIDKFDYRYLYAKDLELLLSLHFDVYKLIPRKIAKKLIN